MDILENNKTADITQKTLSLCRAASGNTFIDSQQDRIVVQRNQFSLTYIYCRWYVRYMVPFCNLTLDKPNHGTSVLDYHNTALMEWLRQFHKVECKSLTWSNRPILRELNVYKQLFEAELTDNQP